MTREWKWNQVMGSQKELIECMNQIASGVLYGTMLQKRVLILSRLVSFLTTDMEGFPF